MPIPVAPDNVVVCCGDSITDQGVFKPAIDQINLALTPRQTAGSVAQGGVAVAVGGGAVCATVAQRPIRAVISGTPGDTAEQIALSVGPRITDHNPNVVILFVGVNDALVATPLATFNAAMDTILAGIAAYNPATPTLIVSIFTAGEQWLAGPVWDNALDPPPSNPGYTPSIAQLNTEQQTAIADSTLTHCQFLDLRGPTLAYEAANNLPAPGAHDGILTSDGVHPLIPKGQNFISSLVVATMAIS
jgi:lysophospholipase L1-like esterase